MPEARPFPDIARYTVPILFGFLFNWALYGVLCVQTYVYSYNFPDDRRLVKLLAYFVFLLETVQTALIGADAYNRFMIGFGDLSSFMKPGFSRIDLSIMVGFTSLIVQVFFSYRIWMLNKRLWWLCLVISVLSVTQAIGALLDGINIRAGISMRPTLYLWFISSVLADSLIAVAMTYLLIQRRGNENRYSSYVLPRVVRLTVETNILTTAVAIVTFALYVAAPNEIYYATPAAVIGKIYSNTLFVTLNNRIYFRDHPFPGGSIDSVYQMPTNPPEQNLPQVRPLDVHVVTMNDTFGLDTLSSSIELEKGRHNVATLS